MAAKLLVLATLVVYANAGLLSLGYGGNGQQGGGYNNGGYLGGNNAGNNGIGSSNNYNNAPLALNHGPLPQPNPQPVVAPLRYAPNPPPLATSATYRHQISQSQPAQLQVSSSYQTGYNTGLGLGNNGNNNGYGGYGLNPGNGNNYGNYGNRGY